MTFRDLADLPALREAARLKRRVAVIGGGLLGVEAACGLAKGGAAVTLVHVMDRLMERQLDARAAAFLQRAVARNGVRTMLNAKTAAVVGEARAEGLDLRRRDEARRGPRRCRGRRPPQYRARATGRAGGRTRRQGRRRIDDERGLCSRDRRMRRTSRRRLRARRTGLRPGARSGAATGGRSRTRAIAARRSRPT